MLLWKYEVGDSDVILGRMIKELVFFVFVVNENYDY